MVSPVEVTSEQRNPLLRSQLVRASSASVGVALELGADMGCLVEAEEGVRSAQWVAGVV